jgi:hypothetical protein
MEPIVHGLKEQYADCLNVKRVNFHAPSPWHDAINPMATPEFALLDSAGAILYRWFGVIEAEEFEEVLQPLCGE